MRLLKHVFGEGCLEKRKAVNRVRNQRNKAQDEYGMIYHTKRATIVQGVAEQKFSEHAEFQLVVCVSSSDESVQYACQRVYFGTD